MDILRISKKALNKAVKVLDKGGVIVCPTDTVYGLLARADDKRAVKKIYNIKNRPFSKPLALFVKDLKMAKSLAQIFPWQEKVLKKHWPGPFTFVFKRKNKRELYGVKNTSIALRIPKYRFLNDLLKKINRPLVQTSVNISGQPELSEISKIISLFKERKSKPDLIIEVEDFVEKHPSQIIDLRSKKMKKLR